MPLILSNGSVVAILVAVVAVGIAAGVFHDQSIKAVYQSVSSPGATQPKFTFVSGTVSHYGGTPLYVFFDETQGGSSLSSGLTQLVGDYGSNYHYQVYLRTGVTYGVRIYYDGGLLSGTQSCAGVPVVITPTGSDYSQNFSC